MPMRGGKLPRFISVISCCCLSATVGATGKVSIDYLFDGGGYQGELAIFSLNGMEKFEPGYHDFMREHIKVPKLSA